MHRFFAEPVDSDSAAKGTDAGVSQEEAPGSLRLLALSQEDARHARTVLRLCPGDQVEALCPEGRFAAVIRTLDADGGTLEIVRSLPDTEPRLRVTLFQGLPKADKMEWIVQKATELGADRIVPLRMARCVVRMDEKDAVKKRERWQKIAREACKQSGRRLIPEVCLPVSLPALPPLLKTLDLTIAPWETYFVRDPLQRERSQNSQPKEDCSFAGPVGDNVNIAVGHPGLLAVRQTYPEISSLGIIIGPEGGIEQEEMKTLTAFGCLPVTLGRRILRTETAGLAALSALMCLYGEMEN